MNNKEIKPEMTKNKTKYQIRNKEGKLFGTFASCKRARTKRDKLDAQHGAYAHHIVEVVTQ